jgi:hypothetical protein
MQTAFESTNRTQIEIGDEVDTGTQLPVVEPDAELYTVLLRLYLAQFELWQY